MEEWKEYKLGDVVRLINGRAYLQHELFDKGKYKIVRVGNLSGGDKWFYSDMELSEEKYCEDGDLLYAWACNFGPYIWKGSKTIYHYHIWKLIENEDVVDKLFLFYYLKYVTPYWLGNVNGSVMVHITKGTMEKFHISLPSLAAQRSIATILKSLDDKIEVNKQINDNLEQQAQALFKSWFVDFEPFKDGEFVESELGMIPKGWKVGTLNEIADITMGASPSGTSYNVTGEGDVFYQGRAEFGFRFPNRNMYTTAPKRFAEIDSVLLSVRAPVGDINVAEEKCCIGRGLASVKSNKGNNSYILYLMKSLNSVFDQFNGEGTVFGSINKKGLEQLSIIIPREEDINKFDKICNPFDMHIKKCETESRRLAQLRDTLLPRLMSGELDVNNVAL